MGNKPGQLFIESILEESEGSLLITLGYGAYAYHVTFGVSAKEAILYILKGAIDRNLISSTAYDNVYNFLMDEISWRKKRKLEIDKRKVNYNKKGETL